MNEALKYFIPKFEVLYCQTGHILQETFPENFSVQETYFDTNKEKNITQ
jgi:hypothetical protein